MARFVRFTVNGRPRLINVEKIYLLDVSADGKTLILLSDAEDPSFWFVDQGYEEACRAVIAASGIQAVTCVSDPDVFGAIDWDDEDIAKALTKHGYDPTEEMVSIIRNCCEHHRFTDAMIESGWNMIDRYIEENEDQLKELDGQIEELEVCPVCGVDIDPADGQDNGYGELHLYWKCEACGNSGKAIIDQQHENTFVRHEVDFD